MQVATDFELVQAIARGDHQAFEEIYRRHRTPVYSMCLRVLRDETDAQDAMQLTFIELLKCANRLEDISKVRSWLFSVAFNKASAFRRDEKKHRDALAFEFLILEIPDLNFEYPDPVLRRRILNAIGNARPRHLPILVNYYLKDRTNEVENSTELSIGIRNYQQRLQKARRLLRETLRIQGVKIAA